MNEQNEDFFINSLSALIDFHLASIQNQVQMISPINDNHQYEEIIKSSEAKQNIVKPSILIPIPEFDHVLTFSSSNNSFNKFFVGKEKLNMSIENLQVESSPLKQSNSKIVSSQKIEIHTKSPSILEVQNFTNTSYPLSTSYSLKYDLNSSSSVELNTEKEIPIFLSPYSVKKSDFTEHRFTTLPLDLNNRTKFYDAKKNYEYSIITNHSIGSDIVKIPSIHHNKTDQIHVQRKRSLEVFFIPNVQVSIYIYKYIYEAVNIIILNSN